MIDERMSREFMDWLGKRSQGQKGAIEDQAIAIAQSDGMNDGIRHRDYWRRTELVAWCEANHAFSRPKGPKVR